MVAFIVPLLLTGCIKGLFEGENTVLRPEIIKYKGTTGTPKPPAKEVCSEPGGAGQPEVEREKHPAPEKPCPPVEKNLLPQELPVQSPQQLMPISPPLPPKSPEKPQSSLADPARHLADGPSPDFSYHDATLTEDVAWRGEVHITGVVTVAPQSTLTVEQGTVVRFGGRRDKSVQNSLLLVHGRVVARGTREKPVLFTSRFAQSMAGDWQGIAVVGSEKKNLLENCRIEGAETGLDSSYSTVTLKNVQFSRCGMGARLRDTVVLSTGGGASGCIVGLYLMDSEAELRDAGVSGNRQGVVAERSSLYLAGGTFSRNDLEALKTAESRVKIAGGSFTVNGAGLDIVSSQGSLSGAKITGNADYGVLLANSRIKVYGNEIARNGGAGLKVEDGKGVAWGNSIFANGEYDLVNGGTEEFRAMGNWWGAADFSAIGKRIYDRQTDSSRGRVFYTPVLRTDPLALL